MAVQEGTCLFFKDANCTFDVRCKFKHKCYSCVGIHGANKYFMNRKLQSWADATGKESNACLGEMVPFLSRCQKKGSGSVTRRRF